MKTFDEELIIRLGNLNSSIVHDSLRGEGLSEQTLPYCIRPLAPDQKAFGRIFTLSGELQKGISTHESLLSWTDFLSNAEPDTVIICQPNNQSIALMGELSAETLLKKNIRGYIVDGGCRDIKRIKELGMPVFCTFFTPKDITARWKATKLGGKIKIDNVIINSGDYVIGDEDGVVIIPKAILKRIIVKSEQDLGAENNMRKAIISGEDPKKAYLKYGKF